MMLSPFAPGEVQILEKAEELQSSHLQRLFCQIIAYLDLASKVEGARTV